MADSSSYDDLFEAETCDIAYVPLLDFDFVDDCFLADPPTTPIVDCPDVDIPPEFPPPPAAPDDSASSSDSSDGCPEFTGDVTINMLPGGSTPTGALTITLDSTDPCTYIAELDLGIPSGFIVPDDCPTFNFTGSVTVDGDPGTMDITVTPNHGVTCEYDVDIDLALPGDDISGEVAIYEIDMRCEEGLLNKYARQVTIGITDNVLTSTTGGWVFLSQEGCCECSDDSTSSSGQDICYTIYDCLSCPGGVPSYWTITGAGFTNDAEDFFCDCNLFDGAYPLFWAPSETHPCRWNYNDGVIDIEMYFVGDTVTITYTVVNCSDEALDPVRVIYEGTGPCNTEATIGVLSADNCATHPSDVLITPCEPGDGTQLSSSILVETGCCAEDPIPSILYSHIYLSGVGGSHAGDITVPLAWNGSIWAGVFICDDDTVVTYEFKCEQISLASFKFQFRITIDGVNPFEGGTLDEGDGWVDTCNINPPCGTPFGLGQTCAGVVAGTLSVTPTACGGDFFYVVDGVYQFTHIINPNSTSPW